MSKQFELFFEQLSETNATLEYFTDFEKVRGNISKISIKLSQLNYLLGKTDIYNAIKDIYEENRATFEVLNILIAIRDGRKTKTLNEKRQTVMLSSYLDSPEKIYEFIKKTGLEEVFKNKDISNLCDYVFGIEVGLDTNARKNRSGDSMSRTISNIFDSANIKYKKEVSSLNFSEIMSLGVDKKIFDFMVKSNTKTYLIEVNYYNGGGSKLNEIARSYSDIASKINQYPNYEFVWITDGYGWKSAKNKLEEAFRIIPKVYNLASIDTFIDAIKKES